MERGSGFAVRDCVHARLAECADRFPDLPIDVLDVQELDTFSPRDASARQNDPPPDHGAMADTACDTQTCAP